MKKMDIKDGDIVVGMVAVFAFIVTIVFPIIFG